MQIEGTSFKAQNSNNHYQQCTRRLLQKTQSWLLNLFRNIIVYLERKILFVIRKLLTDILISSTPAEQEKSISIHNSTQSAGISSSQRPH